MANSPDIESEHGSDGKGLGLGFAFLLGLLAANLIYVGMVLTQYFAWQFGFSGLGPPALNLLNAVGAKGLQMLMVVGVFATGGLALYPETRPYCGLGTWAAGFAFIASYGPVYAPYKGILWLNNALGQSQYAWMENQSVLVVGAGLAFSLACTMPIIALRNMSTSGSHGTAGWSEGKDMQKEEGGVILGRMGKETLNHEVSGHLLTVAPTRTGKGTGAVIPNLLHYTGSALVSDIKGENYAVTKDYRSKPREDGGLGQKTYALDPFRVVEGAPARFNPLDLIEAEAEEAADDASMLAHMIVPDSDGKGNMQHFQEEARNFISGVILYVAATEPKGSKLRSLPYVRELLMLPSRAGRPDDEDDEDENGKERQYEYDATHFDSDYESGERSQREHVPEGEEFDFHGRPMTHEALLQDMKGFTNIFSGVVATSANQLQQKPSRERGSVLSTAQRNTNFLQQSKRMKQSLCQSDFSYDQLMNGETSIYLVMPPNRLQNYRQWLRLMVSCAVKAVARTPGKPAQQVLFFLDEFANLGKMPPVKEAYSLMAGYGMSLWVFVQELPQLKGKYQEEWESFWSNADIIQAFNNSDPMTRREISKMAGETTIFVKSETSSSGSSPGGTSTNRSEQYSEKKRRLITEDEVRRLDDGKQLVFKRGENPVKADKIFYPDEDPYKKRAEENPMYADVGGGDGAAPDPRSLEEEGPSPSPNVGGDGAMDTPLDEEGHHKPQPGANNFRPLQASPSESGNGSAPGAGRPEAEGDDTESRDGQEESRQQSSGPDVGVLEGLTQYDEDGQPVEGDAPEEGREQSDAESS